MITNKMSIGNINNKGLRIYEGNVSTSTGKIIINGVEITDAKSWEKAISTLEEKDKEIERLNNITDELETELEREIEFGKTIPKEADNYNSSLDIRHTLEKVLERLKELKEGK